MALGNVEAFSDWVGRDNPSYLEAKRVESWVNELRDRPWTAPSVPMPEMSNQPEYEVRQAVVPGTDRVEVIYRHTYSTEAAAGLVELIWVGRTAAPPQ